MESAMTETVLFDYWRSTASYRVRIALNLAGITYQSKSVDLTTGAQRQPDHLARNPQGFVPVLEIDGLRLTQSLAILDYLDNTRDMGLLPKSPGERAKVMALAHAIAVDIHPVCNLQVASYAAEITNDQKGIREQWMQRFIRPGLVAFESLLRDYNQNPFCCGDTPGLADICLIPQLYNAHRWGVDISDLSRIKSVETACTTVPAFADAHPDAVNAT